MIPDIYSEQIFDVLRDLVIAGIVFLAFKLAREGAEKLGRWAALWKGALWCLGIGVFAGVIVGRPSCAVDNDPLYGGCAEYADDGYTPSLDQRLSRTLYWTLLLMIPVGMGIGDARKHSPHPWRKPEKPE